jgi:protein involved in ribonucleotide reduction
MSFTRTNAGVSNLHLFYDAEIIIFTEGGAKSFSADEIENDQYSTSSTDIKFWGSVLKFNGYDKKIQFRAIGSKTSSKSICNKIINGEVRNVAVAKDRDLDQYISGLVDSPFILYTKGYSWENDVFTKDLTMSQIKNMLFEPDLNEEIISIINSSYDDFRFYGKHLIRLEIIFRKNGVKFISDFNGERFINLNNFPVIDRKQVKKVLSSKKEGIVRPVVSGLNTTSICPFLSNYGKLIEALSIAVIRYICKKYSTHKFIPKLMVEASMIERFAQKMSMEKDYYYFRIVNRLKAA